METKVASISVIVEDLNSITKLNEYLNEHRDIIIGRMGLPYRQRNMNILHIVVDSKEEEIDSLLKSLTSLDGVSAKAVISS